MLGLRTWNEHVRRDYEIQPVELLMSGDVLQRFTGSTSRDSSEKLFSLFGAQLTFRVRMNERAVASEHVHEQCFSGHTRGADRLGLKLLHTRLQCSADVHCYFFSRARNFR